MSRTASDQASKVLWTAGEACATSPGEAVSVNMVLQLREEVGTVWDVIGEVRGAVEPAQASLHSRGRI